MSFPQQKKKLIRLLSLSLSSADGIIRDSKRNPGGLPVKCSRQRMTESGKSIVPRARVIRWKREAGERLAFPGLSLSQRKAVMEFRRSPSLFRCFISPDESNAAAVNDSATETTTIPRDEGTRTRIRDILRIFGGAETETERPVCRFVSTFRGNLLRRTRFHRTRLPSREIRILRGNFQLTFQQREREREAEAFKNIFFPLDFSTDSCFCKGYFRFAGFSILSDTVPFFLFFLFFNCRSM